jgi:hypothetical protein
MKVNTKNRKIVIPIAIMLLTAGAFAAPRLWVKMNDRPKKPKNRIVITENNKQEKAIISELTKVLHAMDTVTVMTVTGTMTAHDLSDSSNNMLADFCYTRLGNQGYYRVGNEEMISLKDAYIVIMHDMRKIFVSAPKEVVNPVKLSPEKEAQFLSLETYKVTRAVEGAFTRISLVNSKHASCREYNVTFDSAAVIRRAVMRMPDPNAIEDVSQDKLMQIMVRTWENGVARKDLLKLDQYLAQDNGGFKPANRLKGYELIMQ